MEDLETEKPGTDRRIELARLKRLLRSLRFPACLIDGNCVLRHTNREWLESRGLGRGPLLGRRLVETLGIQNYRQLKASLSKALAGELVSQPIEDPAFTSDSAVCMATIIPAAFVSGVIDGAIVILKESRSGIEAAPLEREFADDATAPASHGIVSAALTGLCDQRAVLEQIAGLQAVHSLQDALSNALARGELSLQYQPIVDRSQKVIGMEALMRWNSTEYGQIPPAQFIPMAERSGAIICLGAWALEESCKQLEKWAGNAKSAAWTLSVNVSAHQFNHWSFVGELVRLVEQYGIAPGRLILEVTESVFLNTEGNRLQGSFQRICDAGVGIAVDDFGTGFSSMGYLRNLSVSRIKIDKIFIDEVVKSKKDQGIVEAIIMLARALEVGVVAEGVETAEQLTYLKSVGCSAFQGFYFGRPSDIAQFL